MIKGCLKTVLITVGAILILAAVAALLLMTRGETYATDLVAGALTRAAKTEVRIDSVSLAPLRQTLTVEGLTLMNPPTFKAKPAIEVERLALQVDLRTLFSRSPRIERVVVDGAHVHIRYKLAKGTNLAALAALADEAGQAGEAGGKERSFTIDEFTCENAKVSLSANLIPASSVSFALPPFSLSGDVGNRPLTTGEVTALFLRTILHETLTVKGLLRPVAKLIRGEVRGIFGD